LEVQIPASSDVGISRFELYSGIGLNVLNGCFSGLASSVRVSPDAFISPWVWVSHAALLQKIMNGNPRQDHTPRPTKPSILYVCKTTRTVGHGHSRCAPLSALERGLHHLTRRAGSRSRCAQCGCSPPYLLPLRAPSGVPNSPRTRATRRGQRLRRHDVAPPWVHLHRPRGSCV
jgi:hypothetical protein